MVCKICFPTKTLDRKAATEGQVHVLFYKYYNSFSVFLKVKLGVCFSLVPNHGCFAFASAHKGVPPKRTKHGHVHDVYFCVVTAMLFIRDVHVVTTAFAKFGLEVPFFEYIHNYYCKVCIYVYIIKIMIFSWHYILIAELNCVFPYLTHP